MQSRWKDQRSGVWGRLVHNFHTLKSLQIPRMFWRHYALHNFDYASLPIFCWATMFLKISMIFFPTHLIPEIFYLYLLIKYRRMLLLCQITWNNAITFFTKNANFPHTYLLLNESKMQICICIYKRNEDSKANIKHPGFTCVHSVCREITFLLTFHVVHILACIRLFSVRCSTDPLCLSRI